MGYASQAGRARTDPSNPRAHAICEFYVYEHWRPDRDECFYVGKGKGNRAHVMRARNPHHRAIQIKLAAIGMGVEIRMVSCNLSEQEAFDLEINRINFYKNAGVVLANYSGGGEGNSNPSQETRDKISKANMGKQRRLGKKHSKETKDLLSRLGVQNFPIFEKYRKLGPAYQAKPVICLVDGLVFPSASAAARHYGVSRSALIELCLGKNYRQSVGGLRFKYVETTNGLREHLGAGENRS